MVADTQPVQIRKDLTSKVLKKVGYGNMERYINNLIENELMKEEVRRTIAHLTLLDVEGNKMELKDPKKRMIADVYLTPKGVYCQHDKSFDCIHVKYALTLPELGKLRPRKI